jgi:hypothetical protein
LNCMPLLTRLGGHRASTVGTIGLSGIGSVWRRIPRRVARVVPQSSLALAAS